jgi:hypothetical protein
MTKKQTVDYRTLADFGRTTARILHASESRAFEAVTPESDLALINERFSKVELKAAEVFIFDFELSNTNVDSYQTRMTPQSLTNFATKINERGVPLQPNHDSWVFPIGQIFRAETVQNGDRLSLVCRAYIVRGDENDGVDANAIIRKVETGVLRDVSAGFITRGYTCSVCGESMACSMFGGMYPDECNHWPGEEYNGEVAYAWMEDAELLEGSLVYHGATPGAMVRKVTDGFGHGMLNFKQARSLLGKLQANQDSLTEDSMKGKELLTRLAGKAQGSLAESLNKRSEQISEEATLEDGVVAAEEAVAEVSAENEALKLKAETAEAEVETLKPQAEIGKEAQETAIDEAEKEGVRAFGEAFNAEAMKSTFRAMPLAELRKVTESYKQVADAKLEPGKKSQTEDPNGDGVERSKQSESKTIDPNLYK